MILVVDSSVAVKWFLTEPDHALAVAVSKTAERIYAPELLIAEVTNVAWKEAIRKKISGEQAHAIAAQIAQAPVTFVPIAQLHKRAIEIALEINHPIYDCLYLACAEAFGVRLITADQKILNKTRSFTHANFIRIFDQQVLRDQGALKPLLISRENLAQAIRATELFEATHRNVVEQITRDQEEGSKFYSAQEAAIAFRSPAYRTLEKIYTSLTLQERADFLSLGWLGQGYSGLNWKEIRERAESYISDDHTRYILSLAIYLRAGLRAFDGEP